jgi:hypothetical protein
MAIAARLSAAKFFHKEPADYDGEEQSGDDKYPLPRLLAHHVDGRRRNVRFPHEADV